MEVDLAVVNSALTEIQLPDYSFSKRMRVPQSDSPICEI
jgi:hypothetical protein